MDNPVDLIPQKDPFLFIDKVIDCTEDTITVTKKLKPEMDFYKGHFPGNPITPGVILCESAFQTAALLMAMQGQSASDSITALVSRVQSAKFKNVSRPDDEITVHVKIKEVMANAAFFSGKVSANDQTLLQIQFSCALVENKDIK